MRTTNALLIGCLFLGGCAESVQQQETKLANTMTGFQNQTKAFADARRELDKARRGVIDGFDQDAALSRKEAQLRTGLWRISDEKDKADLYDRIVAETNAAAKVDADVEAARIKRDKDVQDTDTKFQLDQKKLSAAIQAIATLGKELSPEDMVKFYYGFVSDTIKAVDDQRKKAESAQGDGTKASPTVRPTGAATKEKGILKTPPK